MHIIIYERNMPLRENVYMDYCELVPIISAAAVAISNSFSDGETAVLAAAFTQLGDSLATILAGRALCEENKENKTTEL